MFAISYDRGARTLLCYGHVRLPRNDEEPVLFLRSKNAGLSLSACCNSQHMFLLTFRKTPLTRLSLHLRVGSPVYALGTRQLW